MKKSMICCLLALLVLLTGGCAAQEIGEKTFVTSFYPMYLFAQNVTRDVPGVSLINLAGENVGCLHDYQLQTRDMATLERADALIINGGGMEQFMDKLIARQPSLAVIDAGEGIEMLCSEDGHDHSDHHDHAHEVYNAHVWLDPKLAIRQVQRIADGLSGVALPLHQSAQAGCQQPDVFLGKAVGDDGAPSAGTEFYHMRLPLVRSGSIVPHFPPAPQSGKLWKKRPFFW